jgi:hypothetical protein
VPQRLVSRSLELWRVAERLLGEHEPGTGDYEDVRALVIEVQDLYQTACQMADDSAAPRDAGKVENALIAGHEVADGTEARLAAIRERRNGNDTAL